MSLKSQQEGELVHLRIYQNGWVSLVLSACIAAACASPEETSTTDGDADDNRSDGEDGDSGSGGAAFVGSGGSGTLGSGGLSNPSTGGSSASGGSSGSGSSTGDGGTGGSAASTGGAAGSGGAPGTGGTTSAGLCDAFDSETGVELCSETPSSCSVVFDNSSDCSTVCASAGLICSEVWENVEEECAGDFERAELSCDTPTNHESDYCVCIEEDAPVVLADCSIYESTEDWSLCSSTETSCSVIFEDSSSCTEVCAAAGLTCEEVWENDEEQACAADLARPALDCNVPTNHESDYCLCVSQPTGLGGASN